MKEFVFIDSNESKYKEVGEFSEGLAPVLGQNNLWGYIDKKGKEVIPCQFNRASNFFEGLAVVVNNDDKAGYIDTAGNLKIPYQFEEAYTFKEGLAPVKNESELYGYINHDGHYVIAPLFDKAYDFSEGFAVVVKHTDSKKIYMHVNKQGKTFGNYHWAQGFNNGLACIYTDDEIYEIDYSHEKKAKLNMEWDQLFSREYGLTRIKDKKGKYGYLDRNLNLRIPCIFTSANDFQDDVAVVQLGDNIHGFVTTDGNITLLPQEKHYQEVRDFSEGLAPVKGENDLWGFINKTGKEVIPCQYKDVSQFSEGLSGVNDCNDVYHYINKRGTKKLTIKTIYKSALDTGYETISIIANSEKELCEKKLEVLKQVKEQHIQRITTFVNESSSDIISDLYDISKSKHNKKA